MSVTQNSYIPRAWEVSDLKVSGATRPRPLNQILPSHLVYNYYIEARNTANAASQTALETEEHYNRVLRVRTSEPFITPCTHAPKVRGSMLDLGELPGWMLIFCCNCAVY